MTARQHRPVAAFGLTVLLCGVAPAAMAQAIPTANNPATGISAEQALALSARLDALERRNEQLEAVIQDLRERRPVYLIFEQLHSQSEMGKLADALPADPTVQSLLASYTLETRIEDFTLYRLK